MYSEQTIQEVKSKADCVEVIGQFLDLKREGNNMVACCPFHNERSPSFKVEKKENFYKCFGCGKSGDAIQFLMDYDQTKFSYSGAIEWLANYYNIPLDEDQPKVYIKPTWKNQTDLPDKVVKWFESRKISQKTIEKLKITAGKEWMPQVKKEVGVIEFNYFRDGDLINIKYRDSHKNMKLFKDGELIFYNLDSVKGKDEVLITEGECFTDQCELLTPNGWKNINQINGDKIAQYLPDGTVEFVLPLAKVEKDYTGKLVELFNAQRYYSLTTEFHDIVGVRNGKIGKFKANNLPSTISIPRVSIHSGEGISLSDHEIRLCIAVSADFTIRKKGDVYGAIKKTRKIDRLKWILNSMGLKYSCNLDTRGYSSFFIRRGDAPSYLFKLFPMEWIEKTSQAQKQLILQEILYWDGNSVPNRSQIEYSSKEIHNATFIQTIAHLCGYTSTIISRENKFGKWFKVSILFNKTNTSSQALHKKEIDFSGKVYCYTVPSGMLLTRQDRCISVSGNCDVTALIECGLDTNYGIISVPNGANLHGNNLTYIDNSIEHLSHVKKFHIATDNDIPGRKLREQLADRFGKEKCDYIIFKDCKDANDCLIRYGINGVIESIGEKIEFPLEGAFTIKDFDTEIDDMYTNGLDRGVSIGLTDFSLRFVPGYLTTITGAPGSGKSEFVDEIVLRLLVRHQWTGAFYSPENKPTALHFSKIARRIIGKHWDEHPKITVEEKESVKSYLDRKVWFIKPEKDFSLDSILQAVANLKERHGIKWFVIDAWNKIEHKEGSDTDAVGRALEKLVVFCEVKQLHCFLVAHPRKVEKDKNTDKYKVVTMYDIAGSAHFYNKTDNGISVYRDPDTNLTTIYIQKVKFNHWGWRNAINYKFDMPSGRYYYEGNYHGGSWIDKKPLFEQPVEKLPEGNITQRNDEPF